MPSLDLPAIWGSRANTGIGLAFRVIEATRGVHDWFWASNDGCEFIRVMIQAENIGRESIRVQDGEFSIRGRGLRYPCNGNSFAFGPSYEPFEDDINPGEKIIRYFMAEVPKTATDLKLVYRDPDHHWMRAALSLSRDLKDRAKVSIPINLASELTMSPTPIATTLTNTPIPTATAIPSLISNPSPTITPMPTITPTPTQTSTPTTTSTPSSTPTSTATSTITPTPTPVPPSGLSQSQLADARKYALRLINDARTAAGLNTVVLDDNTAAQSHAKDMQENCSTGHWGTDGLKPYMRYTLSGGEEYTSENVSGSGFCPTNPDRYISKTIDAHIDEAMNGLMNSPGHRRNILNPHHRKVNIGISYRHPNLWLVQHFVSDYLDYKTKPTIEDGVLKFSGQTKNGAIATERALGVQIFYDQTPHSLTRGQLHQTYCYTFGTIIAALRRPPGPSAHYPTNSFTLSGTGCNDPYDVPIDAAPASSYFDTKTAFTFPWTERAVWITASRWPIGGKTFEVFANLSDLIDRLGDGVYTILIWGEINGEDVPISEYSIFIPPYSPAP